MGGMVSAGVAASGFEASDSGIGAEDPDGSDSESAIGDEVGPRVLGAGIEERVGERELSVRIGEGS